MRYVCIDLETTGLDSRRDQILEVGAVCDDLDDQFPLAELNKYHAYVAWDRLEGHPKALAMNARIIGRIAEREAPWQYVGVGLLASTLRQWIELASGIGANESIVAAGKNFGSFDLQFLRQLPRSECLKFKHRFLDPAPYFIRPGDREPPKLDLCLSRAGIARSTPHTALEDALLVVEALRAGYALMLAPPRDLEDSR